MAAKATAVADAKLDDAAEDAAGESGTSKPKLPLKRLALAGGALVLLVSLGVGSYFVFGGKIDDTAPAAALKPVAFIDLPEMMINLAGVGGDHPQYLKIKIVLEVPDQAMIALIQPLLPRVIDAFQTYLRELRLADLEGSAGLYRMRDDLTRRVNLAVAPHRINAVLFKEIIVQ